VILKHLATFVWLRTRLQVNQFRKIGLFGQIIYGMLIVVSVLSAVGLLIGGFLAGWLGLPEAPQIVQLLIWDGLLIVFLLVWLVGLLTDLQRNDPLTFDKFLHLPVSPLGAFTVNYISSLFKFSLCLIAAVTTGLILGQCISVGPVMLIGFAVFTAFIYVITALTYQFQGWLAVLMTNPRRRKTIIVAITFGLPILFQAPYLFFNVLRPWENQTVATPPSPVPEHNQEKIIPEQPSVENSTKTIPVSSKEQFSEKYSTTIRWLNIAIPPGWFPLCLSDLAVHSLLPSLLSVIAFTVIGSLSLWRAYRTTVMYHTGRFSSGASKTTASNIVVDSTSKRLMIEWKWPWVSEHASGVASAALRGLLRAAETKMMLLGPIILAVAFAGALFLITGTVPAILRPIMAIAAGAFVLLGGIQIAGNQFGYDRAGFRSYVLSPLPRRDLLLGKNLSLGLILLPLCMLLSIFVSCIYPMRIDYYPMMIILLISLYLLYCTLANLLSILAPLPMSAGAIQPTQMTTVPILWQLGFMMIYPMVIGLVLLPVGAESLFEFTSGYHGWPVALILSLGIGALSVFIYRRGLTICAAYLVKREKILVQIVTSKIEG
jgi:ABC-2 type transport system permease protein